MLSSRSTASGFGPRGTTFVLASAATNASRFPAPCTTSSRARVPTPVSRMTRSNVPRMRVSANASASRFDSSGISRRAGATTGFPPYVVTSAAISTLRRLSRTRTDSPLKEGEDTSSPNPKSQTPNPKAQTDWAIRPHWPGIWDLGFGICLSPPESGFRERQAANAAADDGGDRVAERADRGRQGWFAEPGGRVVGLQEVHFNFRSLCHAGRLVLVEVALHRAAGGVSDLPVHQVAHAFDHRPLSLVDRRARVDDLAADVAGDPDLPHRDAVARINRHLGDVGEVATMAVLERHAHRGPRRKPPRAPAGFLPNQFQHAPH